MKPTKKEDMKRVEIHSLRTSLGKDDSLWDLVAVERPLHIMLNRTHYVTIFCTPGLEVELAVGHLISEGVVNSLDEVREIKQSEDGKIRISLKPEIDLQRRLSASTPFIRIVLSSCSPQDYWPLTKLTDRIAPPKIENDIKVRAEAILKAINSLNLLAKTFRRTGGVHAASLNFPDGEPVAFAEDIGRHNAVDKVIGLLTMKRQNFKETFLTLTGRLTGDIVLKAARVRIPIIASIAAAIDSGIEIAKMTNITLIGFVRGPRMNIYSHSERIILK
jgi:FdhD protein